MNTRTIKLLPGSRNAVVFSATEHETIIHYNCPAWPGKTCIHAVPGRWEIETANANKIKLSPVLDLKPFVMPLTINH